MDVAYADDRPRAFHRISAVGLTTSRRITYLGQHRTSTKAYSQTRAGLAHAQIHIMPNVGHAAFWEDPAAFNQRLRAFVEMCSGVTTAPRAIA